MHLADLTVASPVARPAACAVALLLGLVGAGPAPAASDEAGAVPIDFEAEIRPVLSDKCFHCHGPDAGNRKAGLRLDTPDGVFGETESGARAVTPGEPEESELYWRINAEDDLDRMPPPDSGRSLSREEIERLTRWIEEGAQWQQHWSLIPPAEVAVPDVDDAAWPRGPIDRFVLARLESEGLAPAPEASRERLIRRLSFDLTGLPPTLDEVDAFLADDAPDAYERLVDRLLASPRYGERMAVDWLDLARYADTYGYQSDVYRAVWPWRDWVVRAFNEGMPYDRFVTWQLAGDLLPDAGPEQVMATAFNRLHRQTNEGGSIEEEFRVEYVVDRTNTFGSALLGLTVECARCHDHKYDPISQREYYQFSAFFDKIDESGLYSHFTDAVPTPTLMLFPEGRRDEAAALEEQIRAAEADLDRYGEGRREAFEDWLKAGETEPVPTGLIGDYALDAVEGDTVANRADPEKAGRLVDGPEPVPGRVGGGLALSGENNITLPMGNFTRDDPFAVAFWMQTPDVKDRAVVFRRSQAWTDAGSRGYQLLIEDGALSAALVHFWPGNAIGIRAVEPVPVGRWVHVAFSYDGSSRAEGIKLYVDGRPAATTTVRDNLYKNITGGGSDELTFGQRFRDRGFKGGLVDEIKVFDRALTAAEVARLHDPSAAVGAGSPEELFAYYLANHDPGYGERLEALRALRRRRSEVVDPVAEIMVMEEMAEPRQSYLLERGAYDARGEPVEPGTPSSLPPFPEDLPRNRLGLARWLTDPGHPLTARVEVNRLWQSFFGRGLVATPEDFGSQGQPPSHPKLLDWMARSFVDSGWDVKALVRQIVTSSTYRQSADAPPELRARDPENVLLTRGPRHRLSAEMIRDHALATGGLLVPEIGGPPVKPYQPAGLWEEKSGLAYVRDEGEGSHRRSLYTYWKRTSPPPAMLTLDAAKRDVCEAKRPATRTPLQALVLLNDPQYVEAARGLAESAMGRGGESLDERIAVVFRSLTGRRPSAREAEVLRSLYREQYDAFRSGRDDAASYLGVGDRPPDPALDPDELAALAVLAQAVFNHDESISKR